MLYLDKYGPKEAEGMGVEKIQLFIPPIVCMKPLNSLVAFGRICNLGYTICTHATAP